MGLDVVQVNGGSIEEKVDYAYGLFEKPVKITDIFEQDEMIDTIAITKGRGTEGVVTRWGVSRLPRKTHRGLRKVRSSLCCMCPCCHTVIQALSRPACRRAPLCQTSANVSALGQEWSRKA